MATYNGSTTELHLATTSPRTRGFASETSLGYPAGLTAAPSPEAPLVAIVSPDPDDPVGAGGFPEDAAAALETPIVIDIEPEGAFGLSYACVVVRYPADPLERVAFRGRAPFGSAQFRGGFAQRSSATMVGDVLRLSILPDAGWPPRPHGDTVEDDVSIDVDAVSGEVSDIAGSS